MAGAQFVIDYEVSDNTIPILRNDPILTPGSLALVDLSNPSIVAPATGVIPAGITANYIPNVAWEEAKEVFGIGDANTLGFTATNFLSGIIGKAEITTKKGIHAIVSQVNQTSGAQFFSLYLPQVYRDYFAANAAHKYFISSWRKKTRAYVAGLDFADMALYFQTTSKFLAMEKPLINSISGNGTVPATSRLASAINDLNPQIKNSYFSGGTVGVIDAAATAKSDSGNSLFAAGGGLNAFGSGQINKYHSVITYRVYIEDLTVSGRTYAEVDAIDNALFTAAFASGGKFFGDTFTDPVTLP